MSDSDPKLPDPTGAGAPPPDPVPTPPAGSPPPPDAVAPTLPTAMDATTQMPTTEAGDVPPPVPPLDAPGDAEPEPNDETPWYKKPGPIALMVVVALAIIGLLAWLIFGGGDDEDNDATATSSLLIIETTDITGSVLDVGFIVSVVGPADAPTAFEWLRPDDAAPGEAAGASTGTDGRVDFEWEADDTVTDPEGWLSTVTAVVNVPAGWTPPGPVVDCVLDPLEGQQSVVSMNVELDSPDESVDRTAGLTFPNYTFTPGDAVTCRLAALAPAPTTSSTVVDTTTPETTTPETTTPETTVAETTTTTATTTTAAATTTTTVLPTIPPPTVGQSIWDVIESNDELSALQAAIEAADPSVQELLDDPDATITLFAPSNDAIAAAGTTADITALLLAHVDDTSDPALLLADVLALPSVPVAEGGPQPVDPTAGTVGGAMVIQADIVAENGVIHVIDAVMPIQP